jgi:hypothetical protein
MDNIMAVLGTALLIAYVAAGLIEWVKAGIEMLKKPKAERALASIIAWVGLPVACLGAAALFDGGIWVIAQRAAEAWATAQLAYPLVVKLPVTLIESLKPKAPTP